MVTHYKHLITNLYPNTIMKLPYDPSDPVNEPRKKQAVTRQIISLAKISD